MSGFEQIVIHNTLEIAVYSYTDGSRNSQFSFMMCGVQELCISPLGAQFTKMAIETITADMLQTVWNELDFRVDVCRITKGAHIEHL